MKDVMIMDSISFEKKLQNKLGFSLIELSVVIVIIGFASAIFFAGQTVMQTYKVNGVVAEISYYENAKKSFIEKYGYRPGDVPVALFSQYFDDYADGDGDNDACGIGSLGNNKWDNNTEKDLAWLQLYNVKMIKNRVRFDPCNAPAYRDPDIHRPLSDSIKASGWTFLHSDIVTANSVDYEFYYVTRLGRKSSATDKDLSGGAMTVAMHMAIDIKIDSPYTPVGGRYFVDEECIDTDGTYLDEQDPARCTGNYAEINPLESGASYTP